MAGLMTPGTVTASRDEAPHTEAAEVGHPQPNPSAGASAALQGCCSQTKWRWVRLRPQEAGLRYSRVALETEHRIAEFFTVP